MKEVEGKIESGLVLENIDLDSMGDVELVLELEELYGITMENERLQKVMNAGDLFDYLVELVGADSERRRVCLTAATYYRLRRGLEELTGEPLNLRPDTNIEELIVGMSGERPVKAIWSDLESASKLTLPGLLCLGFSRRFPWLVSRICPNCSRLGGLTKYTATLNHSRLAEEYGQNSIDDLWTSFRRLLGEAACEERYEMIGRETRLFP